MAKKALQKRTASSGNPTLDGWLDLLWQFIKSDSYTPTLTDVTNLDSSTAAECSYVRIGDTVIVGFRAAVNPTAAAATELGVSLPIPSNFANARECAGSFSAAVSTECGLIDADVTNNRATVRWIAVTTSDHNISGTFMYRII